MNFNLDNTAGCFGSDFNLVGFDGPRSGLCATGCIGAAKEVLTAKSNGIDHQKIIENA